MGFFNQGIGSGGGASSSITGFRFNNDNSSLTITTSDGRSHIANLSELKTEWQRLKDVTVSPYFANLVHSAFGGKFVNGILDANGASRPNNPDWVNIRFKVKAGHTYRLANATASPLSHNPPRCAFFTENDAYVSEMNWVSNAGTVLGNKRYAELRVPDNLNNTIVYASCNLRITGGFNERSQLMIWDISESDTPTEYVEFKKGGVLIGESVDKKFNSTTGLTSQTIDKALDELNRKIGDNSSNAFSSVQLSTDTNSYEFRNSNSEVVGNIPLMTNEEVENIKNLFIFN